MDSSSLRCITVSESSANQKRRDDSKRSSNSSVLSWGVFRCHICNVSGSGLTTYEEHMDSELHLKSLQREQTMKILVGKRGRDRKNSWKGGMISGVVQTPYGPQFDKRAFVNSSAKRIPLCRPQDKYSLYVCKICNIKISGRIPFLEHLVSNEHQQKELQKLADEKKAGVTEAPGAVSYQQQVTCRGDGDAPLKRAESSKRLKRSAMQKGGDGENDEKGNKANIVQTPYLCQNDKSHANESVEDKHLMSFCKSPSLVSFVRSICEDKTSSLTDVQQPLFCGHNLSTTKAPNILISPFYCNVCNVDTSGVVSYQQHIAGRPHYLKEMFNTTVPQISRGRKKNKKRRMPYFSANIVVKH